MQPTRLFALSAVALAALLAGCASSGPFNYTAPNLPAQPEGASGWTDKPGWATEKFAVAAANPLVVEVPAALLVEGTNVIAVETHVNYRNTPDVTFGAQVDLVRR